MRDDVIAFSCRMVFTGPEQSNRASVESIEGRSASRFAQSLGDRMIERLMAPGPARPPKMPPKEPLIKRPGNGQPAPQDKAPPDPDEQPEIDIPPPPLPEPPPIIPPDIPERRVTDR
jgi:hypothetical protein